MPKVSPARFRIVARRRLETIQRFRRLLKNHNAAKAAQMVGTSVPTLWRWSKKFSRRGEQGLYPENYKSGRRSQFSGIRLTARALRELELFLVEECHPRAAWRQFAGISSACPPLLAAYVRRTGRAPVQFAQAVRLNAVKARCYISPDGRRLYVKLPMRGTLKAQLFVPTGLKLEAKK